MKKIQRPEPTRAVLVLCAAQFVDVLGVTELISALPRALAQLGASPAAAGPAVTAYAMCFGGLLMLGARLGARHRPPADAAARVGDVRRRLDAGRARPRRRSARRGPVPAGGCRRGLGASRAVAPASHHPRPAGARPRDGRLERRRRRRRRHRVRARPRGNRTGGLAHIVLAQRPTRRCRLDRAHHHTRLARRRAIGWRDTLRATPATRSRRSGAPHRLGDVTSARRVTTPGSGDA